MTLQEFAWVLEQIPILQGWISTMTAAALDYLMEGKKVPGFKLVQGKANRIFSDKSKASHLMLRSGIPQDDYAPRSLVSPAQAEKLFKKFKLTAKWDKIAKLIERPEGEVTFAKDSDPRPAYTRGAEFKNLKKETKDG